MRLSAIKVSIKTLTTEIILRFIAIITGCITNSYFWRGISSLGLKSYNSKPLKPDLRACFTTCSRKLSSSHVCNATYNSVWFCKLAIGLFMSGAPLTT